MVVTIHEAKTQFSHLLTLVEGGEEVVITRNGKPIARLTAYTRPRRQFGFLDATTTPDFFEPMTEEELAEWE